MEIGIRELRAQLSRYVERVKAGEEIVVTDHGTAVARLVPLAGERKVDRLIRDGIVVPARTRSDWLPEPIAARGTLSDIVIEQRG